VGDLDKILPKTYSYIEVRNLKKIVTVLLIGFIIFPFWGGTFNWAVNQVSRVKTTISTRVVRTGDAALQGVLIGTGNEVGAAQGALSGARIGITSK
jgi:hypothetical protein